MGITVVFLYASPKIGRNTEGYGKMGQIASFATGQTFKRLLNVDWVAATLGLVAHGGWSSVVGYSQNISGMGYLVVMNRGGI